MVGVAEIDGVLDGVGDGVADGDKDAEGVVEEDAVGESVGVEGDGLGRKDDEGDSLGDVVDVYMSASSSAKARARACPTAWLWLTRRATKSMRAKVTQKAWTMRTTMK
jgi:hypothetical protein